MKNILVTGGAVLGYEAYKKAKNAPDAPVKP
jgi:hypothetical protein